MGCRPLFTPGQGTGRGRQPALVLSSWASRRICAQKPRPMVIPLEPEVRQLVPAQLNCLQAHWSQNKFGGGESTARLYLLLGNNSHIEKTQAFMARHQEISPATIRAHHLQSLLMLRAAAISQHNHSDKPSEETVLDNSDVREEQREMNIGDVDS